MISLSRLKGSGIGLATLALFLAFAYWGYRTYARSQLQSAVVELVKDSSDRLQAGFAVDAGAGRAVARLDDLAQEVDKHVIELNRLSGSRNRPLVDAAEEYLLTIRQILRSQAASQRYRAQVAARDRALREHMRSSNRRSRAWIDEAVGMKDRLERDYFDYRMSAEAQSRLLESLPEVSRKLALHVGKAPLADEAAVKNARKSALENSRRVADEVEQARQLAAVR
jgi:hypothetical protein